MKCEHAARGGFLLLLPLVRASWWLLGMPAAYQTSLELKPTTYQNYCRKLQYLGDRQRELCGLNPNILQTVGRGAKMGIDECQHQFRMSRWNCTTFSNTSTVFGGVMDVRSREKAYVYAISAAGVAYSVTRACSKGELGECRCDELVRKRDNGGRWKWGGCSDDIKFGARFSKDFVDSGEDQRAPEGLMNIHNNEAGRRGLRSKMELVCKCHGVSGSCSMRVCWRRLKPFREIGDLLTSKFDGATLVKAVERRHKTKLRPVRKNVKRPSKKDLVYLDDSPDYCVRNETLGVLGTRGRLCNSTSYGMDGCRLLCCGRGYQTVIREVEEKCQCKFVWCCKVHCEMCSFKREEHYCN
ncbi:protein Wnt-5a [Parasteatoda tepidariorum]|uniref:protein Wnt-5a n=1 Tax=Parasteatoda tepidariorum TaxID=114398 RepID=UPI00077F995C|nr:protein Wnt-1 [Parasteatoda tepidariorum]